MLPSGFIELNQFHRVKTCSFEMSKYLTKAELIEIESVVKGIKDGDLISSASYDESEILKKLNTFSADELLKLGKCTIHVAIIGAGGKNFGKIMHDGEILEISDIFDEFDIKYSMDIDEKYEVDTLTARRLVRVFRFATKRYIEEKKIESYLWKKYSTKNKKYISICFPGSEHFIEKEDEVKYLLSTYEKMDETLNTKFVERMKRVFDARNVKY